MHWWNERSLSESKESCAFEIRRWYYRYSGAGRWGTCYTGLFEIGEAVGGNPRSRIVEGGYYWISTEAGANQWPGLQACWHVGRAVGIVAEKGVGYHINIIITSPLQDSSLEGFFIMLRNPKAWSSRLDGAAIHWGSGCFGTLRAARMQLWSCI